MRAARAFLYSNKAWLRVLLFLLVLLIVAEATGLRSQLSLTAMQAQLAANKFSALAIFIALFAIGNLLHFPGWIFLAAAVLVLGQVVGGLVTYLAANVVCASTFLMVRWLGGDAVRQLKTPWAVRAVNRLHPRPIRTIMLLRVFLQTMPTVNYVLAMSGVGFWNYMAGTLLGLPFPITVYCLFFDTLFGFLRS